MPAACAAAAAVSAAAAARTAGAAAGAFSSAMAPACRIAALFAAAVHWHEPRASATLHKTQPQTKFTTNQGKLPNARDGTEAHRAATGARDARQVEAWPKSGAHVKSSITRHTNHALIANNLQQRSVPLLAARLCKAAAAFPRRSSLGDPSI